MRLHRKYAGHVAEYFNVTDVTVTPDGDAWIGTQDAGRWLTDAEKSAYMAWLVDRVPEAPEVAIGRSVGQAIAKDVSAKGGTEFPGLRADGSDPNFHMLDVDLVQLAARLEFDRIMGERPDV